MYLGRNLVSVGAGDEGPRRAVTCLIVVCGFVQSFLAKIVVVSNCYVPIVRISDMMKKIKNKK